MRKLTCCLMLAACGLLVRVPAALAVTANPLEDAYWRFESGTDGLDIGFGENAVTDDSGNGNNMSVANAGTAPKSTSNVAPFQLRSGLPNDLALNFTRNTPAPGGDDLYTVDRDIDNGMIGPTVAPGITGFTLEAAFRPTAVNAFQAIVAKEGVPSGPLPTLALKVRDNGNLQIELFDKASNLVDVQSTSPLVAGEWYAAAVVNDGSTLSLYLRGEDDLDYVLQGSTSVSGALYQGGDGNDWDKTWAIGRSIYGSDGTRPDGIPADWFGGTIDEVRLSNEALLPSQFLFLPSVPEPSSFALVALLGAAQLIRRKRN